MVMVSPKFSHHCLDLPINTIKFPWLTGTQNESDATGFSPNHMPNYYQKHLIVCFSLFSLVIYSFSLDFTRADVNCIYSNYFYDGEWQFWVVIIHIHCSSACYFGLCMYLSLLWLWIAYPMQCFSFMLTYLSL